MSSGRGRSGGRPNARTPERGQTLHDFALGMVVFLLVLGYVFAFVPSMFAPFSQQSDSSPVRADRTADYLSKDVLVDDVSNGGQLNDTCTEAFFELDSGDPDTPPDGCKFGHDANLSQIATLPAETTLNVTMQRHGVIATVNGTRLAEGSAPDTTSGRVTDATRVVSLDGRDYRFVVRIW